MARKKIYEEDGSDGDEVPKGEGTEDSDTEGADPDMDDKWE